MRQQPRKENFQSQVSIQIPPLKLPDIDISDSPPKPNRSKDHCAFLKPTPLEQNGDFLREKSLYRYAISRKGSKHYLNKSQANLLSGQQRLNRTESNLEQSKGPVVNISKEKSILSGTDTDGQNKQRHFRRKTQNQQHFSYSHLPHRATIVRKVADEQNYQRSQKQLKTMTMKLRESQSTSEMNEEQQLRDALQEMRRQLINLKEENQQLSISFSKKCGQLQLLELKYNRIREQNEKLLEEARRNCKIHSDSFITENKLQNQMRLRDSLIVQLQDRIKYLELENITLKKTKTEKANQENLIAKLQKKNKSLEDKVKILTKIKTKRNHLTGSMISEFSDLSLNLSADDDEADCRDYKFYPALKTAQKTPDKRKCSASNRSQLQQMSELLSPLWKPRMRA